MLAEDRSRSLVDEFDRLAGERSPEAALAGLFTNWSARLRSDAAEMSRLLESMPALSARWRAGFESDAVDYTVDRIGDDETAWFSWWTYLLEHGSRPTCAIVSNLDAIGDIERALPGHLEQLRARLEEGQLALRLIVPAEARIGPARELVGLLHRAGVEIRVGDVSGWFAVTPERAALIPAIWGRDRNVDAMVIRTSSLLSALEQLFLARWERALPWAPDGGSDPVIDLLCLGRTDAQVADRLGISIRSVRRRVAAAMRQAGASTRMELAYRLRP